MDKRKDVVEAEEKDVENWSGAEKWLSELVEQAKSNAKRWFWAFVITLAALIMTNLYWIYQFTSYDFISQDGSGINSINTGNQENIDYVTEGEN